MARGWESKSVEDQLQAAETERGTATRPKLTAAEAERQRQRDVLLSARARIVTQLQTVQNPRYRKLLETELAALNERIDLIG